MMGSSGISVELTRSQIDRIVREAGEDNGVATLLLGLADSGAVAERYASLSGDPRLSRSLLLGLLILGAFPSEGNSLGVIEVAALVGMTPSTTYRYVHTLLTVGLLAQDPRTRRYRLAASD
jgi:hypothetical protein